MWLWREWCLGREGGREGEGRCGIENGGGEVVRWLLGCLVVGCEG